jgi:hypothetical protein
MVCMTNALLLKSIPYEEFDYQTLLDAVHGYARPRMKISGMLAKGDIVRVKKGLYILGEPLRRHPFCRELLANLIYGPSYVSLEYALHYHGLTPERAETVTSVTCGRSRTFDTPAGTFSYRMIPAPSLSPFRKRPWQTGSLPSGVPASPRRRSCATICWTVSVWTLLALTALIRHGLWKSPGFTAPAG